MKRIISIVLCFIFTFSLFTVSIITMEASEIKNSKLWYEKISEELWDKFNLTNKNEKTPVWIWFSDINQDEVDSKVKENTGLTADNISVDYGKVPVNLIKDLEEITDYSNNSKDKDIAIKIEKYINQNKLKIEKEKYRVKEYVKEKKKVASSFYNKKNTELINILNISKNEIIFQSQLTPSIVVSLTEKQIKTIAKSDDVVSIDYYDDSDQQPPLYEEFKTAMRVNEAKEQFSLSGEGVNVLMNDHGCVRSDYDSYDSLLKPENIISIINKKIYSITDTTAPHGNIQTSHPNLIAGAMQEFAEDVNIFSTGYRNLDDVEWTLLNFDIHFINGSVNYGTKTNYLNDSYAKWFDALVSTYNVTLIASAGNSKSWQESGWPNVISPSSGYNSIAVGAYSANGVSSEQDTMRNYRYNPTTSADQVCYKPDVVIASYDTSRSSPNLSGIVAMMIQLKPSLSAHPELIKAILMASCHRKVNPAAGTDAENIFDGLTQRQGAGAVDAYRAIQIVLQGTYDFGNIDSGDVNSNNIQIENGHNVNVSLAWLRQNTNIDNSLNDGSTLVGTLQELELKVYSNSELVGTSNKLNTGKQMVYFSTSNTNNQYQIQVTKTTNNADAVRYAYAWSTEDNYITLHTDNSYGELSKDEVTSQLHDAGIDTNNINNPFSVSFDETVVSIGDNAFEGYHNLSSVTINRGITSIGKYAFNNCSLLEDIVIPDGLLTINEGAFQKCYSLKNVIIGNSVRSIETKAFYHCFSLANVTFKKYIAPTIRNNAFLGLAKDATAHIPIGAVGYAENYDDLIVLHVKDVRTIYFTDNRNWENINAYIWKDGISYFNNDISMEYAYTNYLNERIFSVTFDYNEYDMIKFYDADGEESTVNINVGDSGTGYYLTDEESTNTYEISTYCPDVRTIYFKNSNDWSDVRAYLWKSGTTQDNLWHGAPMTFISIDPNEDEIYSITLDYNEFDSVVFNDYKSSEQTVDIKIGDDGTAYYLTGSKSGKNWQIGSYIYTK